MSILFLIRSKFCITKTHYKSLIKMKTKLAAFDFDSTVFDTTKDCLGLLHLFPKGETPETMAKAISAKDWDTTRAILTSEINKMNVTKQNIIEGMLTSGEFVPFMDEALKGFAKDHDIIIISGGWKMQIEVYLEKHGLLKYINKIYATPVDISEDAKITIKPIPEKWRKVCENTGRQFCKEHILKGHLDKQNQSYEQVVYIGDSMSDLCASQSLGNKDIVCPRKGFKLDKVLETKNVEAQIISWKDGKDLMEKLNL